MIYRTIVFVQATSSLKTYGGHTNTTLQDSNDPWGAAGSEKMVGVKNQVCELLFVFPDRISLTI